MHSLIVSFAICMTLLIQAWGLRLSFSTTAIVLAVCVAMIGLPHGALDHKIGTRLLGSFSAPASYAIFFLSYLTVAAVVVAGWFLSPVLTVFGFFCLSVWHFGLEEDERKCLSWMQWLSMVARGGMVIWIPTVFQGEAITQLLTSILPAGDILVAKQIVTVITIIAPLLAILTIFDAFTYRNETQQGWMGFPANWQHRLRLLAFAILFAAADPLVSFGIYFCGWHSIRGLVHLREQFGFSTGNLLLKLTPISALAIGLFGVGFLFSRNSSVVTPAIIQTLFIGLSAVAIPHLLLHIVSDSIRSKQAQGAVL
ncbi:MAG: Brp/Blh family beta-carotene 15,15'-monooxygenase [Mariniblastus sp.]|jgi:Brp/Blh family beta-carotene 15,15'-monooxygenase